MLEIEAKLARTRAFVGESLVIEMLVQNRGSEAVETTKWGDPADIELRDASGATRTLSWRPFRLSPIETPVARQPFRTVYKAGDRSRLFMDIAELAGEQLTPGRYECAAVIAGSYSNWLSFELEAPRISAPSIHDGYAAWITDGTELFVRPRLNDPDRASAARMLSGVSGLQSVGVAEQCFAVLVEDKLAIGCVGHRALGGWLQGPAVELDAPRVVEGRWIQGDTSAFLVAGKSAARTASVRLSADSPLQSSKPRDLELGPILPLVLPPVVRTMRVDGGLVAVWAEGSRVLAHSLVPGAVTRTLLDRGSEVLAFEVGRSTVEVLLPEAQVHVRLDGSIQYEKPVPSAPHGVTSWAIGPEPGAAVIARVGNTIMTVRDSAWRDVITLDAGATRVGLVASHWPQYWVQWIDPARGLRHAPIE